MVDGDEGGQMSGLKIYGVARTRAFRAVWIAEELKLAYEHVPIEIGEDGMKAILGLRMPGREPVERFGIAIDRGDAMARSQQRIRHRKTDAARCPGEKNDAAVRRCHDCLRPRPSGPVLTFASGFGRLSCEC